MQLQISRELLLQTLSAVANAVERKSAMQVLGNIKFELSSTALVLTASDLEVELMATLTSLPNSICIEPGEITLPARKLIDICKSLPNNSQVKLTVQDNDKCQIKSGSSRFSLGTLPASDFPSLGEPADATKIMVNRQDLKNLIDKTSFAMAVQDVRFYLTGMLFEAEGTELRTVATDGHRLAFGKMETSENLNESIQAVVPRKAVSELQRLLGNDEGDINLTIGREFFQVQLALSEAQPDDGLEESLPQDQLVVRFTSRLIDGKYPDYRRVMPDTGDKVAEADREVLKQVLQRVSILSHEKSRGIIFDFDGQGKAQIRANNAEQDEAVEDINVEYDGEQIELSFNASYLLDVVNVLPNIVRINMTEANSSVLVNEADDANHQYVIMPMRI